MSDIIKLSFGDLSLTVDTLGAELKSLKKGNNEYIWCGDENVWGSTAPILFPICGALKDDVMHYGGKEYNVPKHGFANHNEFTLSEKTENSITLSFSSNENTLKIYPFDFIFSVKFELNDNKLNVYYIVENTSNKNMYFSLGAHEGFALDGGVEGAKVEANVVKNGKGKKIYILKYKSKKNEKKKMGHRQPYTKVQITKIEA